MACHFIKGAALNDAAFFKDDDAVGERKRIKWIVGDDQRCYGSLQAKAKEIASDFGFGTNI
jgi:hypothetical protein